MAGADRDRELFSYRARMRDAVGHHRSPPVSDSFVLVTSCFNLPYVRSFLRDRADRLRFGLWTDVESPGLVTRKLSVTIHGELEAITDTRRAVGLPEDR